MNPKAQKPVLDPGSPAQASLSILAVQRPGSLFGSAPERARPPISPPLGPKASRPSMFRGPSWVGPLFRGALSPAPGRESTFRKRKHQLFRRLLPTGPTRCVIAPRSSASIIACRRRSVLLSPAAPSCRCRPSGEAGTSVPITIGTLHNDSESRQAENEVRSLWITGISR